MKHIKKFASFLLALVMVLSLTTTVFAADTTGSITIDNPQKDQTYTAYKIFDVVYNNEKTAYSYTIDSTNEWFSTVKAYADGENSGLKLEQVTGSTTYIVTEVTGFSAPSFAAALKAATTDKTGAELTVNDGKAAVSNLPLGYYFVTSTSGALCNLTTTNPSVTIHDKNDIPFDKVDDKESVEVGEVVNYVITGKVPDTTGFETYKYQITDTMSEGLTFNNDVKVYIDGTELTNNFTLKTGTDAGEKDFVLDIDVMKLTVGAKIEVKYSATVNENAVAKIEKNHATLEYSNDPTDSTKTTTREDEETVYSAKINIDKYAKQQDEQNTSKKLAGAKFVLYKEVTEEGATEATKLYYKYTAATETEKDKVEWVADQEDATEVTTDDKGAADFKGLKDGTYYLLETEAPAGYNMLKEPVTITINGTKTENNETTIAEAQLTHTEHVANNTGSELPSTGGIGTTIFYVLGSILLIGAVVLLVTKKRMNSEQ